MHLLVLFGLHLFIYSFSRLYHFSVNPSQTEYCEAAANVDVKRIKHVSECEKVWLSVSCETCSAL